jgi:predicted nucleotidyltransferase
VLEESVEKYIKRLISAYPTILSVWLLGSRANGSYKPDSDWDLLVFGSQKVFDDLKLNQSFHHANMDLLVVYNGNDFEKPWGEKQKRGSLTGWKWKALSETESTYRATKSIFGEDGEEEFNVKVMQCKAYRVYP